MRRRTAATASDGVCPDPSVVCLSSVCFSSFCPPSPVWRSTVVLEEKFREEDAYYVCVLCPCSRCRRNWLAWLDLACALGAPGFG